VKIDFIDFQGLWEARETALSSGIRLPPKTGSRQQLAYRTGCAAYASIAVCENLKVECIGAGF